MMGGYGRGISVASTRSIPALVCFRSVLHRVDYDDSQSLRLKYEFARSAGARGTGMWTASALDYAGDPGMGKTFWQDLKQFTTLTPSRIAVAVRNATATAA